MSIVLVLNLLLHIYYILVVQPSCYEQFDKFLKLGIHDDSTNHSKFDCEAKKDLDEKSAIAQLQVFPHDLAKAASTVVADLSSHSCNR